MLLGRVSRGRLHRGSRSLGRVDLDFRDGAGWRLIVELKIDSGLGEAQLERYAEEAPVALVSRDPGRFEIPDGVSNWVGAVAWSEILGSLPDLPVTDRKLREDWRSFLDVVEEDGDFSENKVLRREVLEARNTLSGAAPEVLDGLRAVLRRAYRGSAENLCEELVSTGVRGGRSGWATVELKDESEWWAVIQLRDVWSRTPRVRVYLNLAPSRRERRQLRRQLAGLSRIGIEEAGEDFVFDEPISVSSVGEITEQLTRVVVEKLAEVVALGVYDLVFQE